MPWMFQCENYCSDPFEYDPSNIYPSVTCAHCGQECCINCIRAHEASCDRHLDCDCGEPAEETI